MQERPHPTQLHANAPVEKHAAVSTMIPRNRTDCIVLRLHPLAEASLRTSAARTHPTCLR